MTIARLADSRTARAAKLQRLINDNVAVRSRFEKIAGGIVVLDGRMDGTISMRSKDSASRQGSSDTYSSGISASALTSPGTVTDGSGSNAMFFPPGIPLDNIYEMLNGLDAAVLQQAASLRPGAGQFAPLGYGDLLAADPSLSLGVNPNNVSGSANMYSSGESGALTGGDPSTTATDDTANESVDLGTERLQTFIQKRDQMYDLVRQIFTAYNQNAQKAVDNMKG
jgi:hypothetical protein